MHVFFAAPQCFTRKHLSFLLDELQTPSAKGRELAKQVKLTLQARDGELSPKETIWMSLNHAQTRPFHTA
jgi:hypothetical protein